MKLFDGVAFAAQRELELAPKVQLLRDQGRYIRIVAILFAEDAGSRLYTQLKRDAAERVGIEYQVLEFSLRDPVEGVQRAIKAVGDDPNVTGIIIQKPWRKTWRESVFAAAAVDEKEVAAGYQQWWQALTSEIHPDKDVDGLHPHTLAAVEADTWEDHGKVLPATCRAVLQILETEELLQPSQLIAIIGASDLMGKPLAAVLHHRDFPVELMGTKGLAERKQQGRNLFDADVVVSATGVAGVITGDLLKDGAAVVDVGEPRPDVDRASVAEKARFLTPVPGGVGPMTVISLLENAYFLATR